VIVKLSVAFTVAVLAASAALIFWDPCVRPEITVANASGQRISDLVISGVGFQEALGSLEPGQSTARPVECAAESGLKVSFNALGVSHSTDDLAYLESCGGYRVQLKVESNYSVTVVTGRAY
jgi:hypothetical protein